MFENDLGIFKYKCESIKEGKWFIENKCIYVNVVIKIPDKEDFIVKLRYEEIQAIYTQASFNGKEYESFSSDLKVIFSVYKDFVELSSIRNGFNIRNYEFKEMIKLRDYIPEFSREDNEKYYESNRISFLWRLGYDISLFSNNYKPSNGNLPDKKPKHTDLPYIIRQLATNRNELIYNNDSYISIVKDELRSPIRIANVFLKENKLSHFESINIQRDLALVVTDNFVLVTMDCTCDTYLIPYYIHRKLNQIKDYSLSPQQITLC